MAVDRRVLILQAAGRVIARNGVRGLRVDEVAREAGVSTALLYYHFDDRAGLLQSTLDHITEEASLYTERAIASGATARDALEQVLLLELQGDERVLENSRLWGELRASAVFDETLRAPVRRATEQWSQDIAAAVRRVAAEQAAPAADADADDAGQRLTALVEGLSMRWLSGTLELERARALLRDGVAGEMVRLGLSDPGAPRPAPT
jgi:AcrR family transcriptional regulator